MLPVEHPAPQILMAVDDCGHQQAQSLGLVAPMCFKKNVQPLMLEHTSICCNMTGGLIGAMDADVEYG